MKQRGSAMSIRKHLHELYAYMTLLLETYVKPEDNFSIPYNHFKGPIAFWKEKAELLLQ
jgi:hypothetical protein